MYKKVMTKRSVELVMAPREPHFVGDGFRVHNFIPSGPRLDMTRMSPFIMLDYNSPWYFSPSATPRGVGVHPHRGFETVTIAYQGRVAHRDSSGNAGVIGEGDVQWMTAGAGILHEEYHEEEYSRAGGDFQMVQLWVNLPAKDKMTAPKYQSVRRADMSTYTDGGAALTVIAGEYEGIRGKASTFTPVHMYDVRLAAGARLTFSFPAEYNTALLQISGRARINESEEVPADHLALMANDGEAFEVTGVSEARLLLLSGEPIMEPIAAHGPFVMNTQEEIAQAFLDFRNGRFGRM
jgi:quercetin 2,3-dioxygenase